MEMTLRMPSIYVDIDREEREYVEGGTGIAMSKSYLSKDACITRAHVYCYFENGGSLGLSELRVAKEIYAHAVVYYTAPWLLTGIAGTVGAISQIGYSAAMDGINWIYTHGDPIDIGGDSSTRVAIFNAIWAIG